MQIATFFCATIAVLMFTSCDEEQGGSTAKKLEAAEWKHRVFVVHVGDPDSDAAIAFEKDFAKRQDDIRDRDLIRIAADQETRARYKIDESAPVTVLLFGKDGGLKSRQVGDIDLDEFFKLIDSMPMRRREIQSR